MSLLVCAGVGQLNRRVAHLWQAEGGTVMGLRRREPDSDLPFPQVSIDLSATPWPDLGADQIVVALSASHRSEAAYQQAYLHPVQRLVESIQSWRAPPKRVVVVSSTRVYGLNDATVINDNDLAQTDDPYGQILLAMEACLKGLSCEHAVVRLSGLYGPGRDWLKRMALNATPETVTQNKWTNRIHIDDAAAAIVHVLKLPKVNDHYIVSDTEPMPLIEMLNYFRRNEDLENLDASEPPLAGKRLIPSALSASGFQWQFPHAFSGGYEC